MILGFVLGLGAGYGRTLIFGPADMPESARWIMASQIAFCFMMLALFVANYLDLRQRVIRKAEQLKSEGS